MFAAEYAEVFLTFLAVDIYGTFHQRIARLPTTGILVVEQVFGEIVDTIFLVVELSIRRQRCTFEQERAGVFR